MTTLKPINQTQLFGLNEYLNEFIKLYKKDKLPNKILLSGRKGIGKATLAYHFINYVLSENEKFSYEINNFEINSNSQTFKTILNRSNPNFILIDIDSEQLSIDIKQIRNLINILNKSSFNDKKRFVLIDNVDYLNVNSINALLKILEEPSTNVNFILINNNKKILSTLTSRCIEFKIFLDNDQNFIVADRLLNGKLKELICTDLINYYSTPGNIYNLVMFAKNNAYDLRKKNLREFLEILINDNHYKKDYFIKSIIFEFIEFYFSKINSSISSSLYNRYNYFLKRISDTKRFNLDEESLFMEFKQNVLDG